jgi:hypothetical protein
MTGAIAGGEPPAALNPPWATAASGFLGSSAGAGPDRPGPGIPGGDPGPGPTGATLRTGPGCPGAGALGETGGGGVEAAGGPILCRRDFRSIFGFGCSAIVRAANLRALPLACQREQRPPHALPLAATRDRPGRFRTFALGSSRSGLTRSRVGTVRASAPRAGGPCLPGRASQNTSPALTPPAPARMLSRSCHGAIRPRCR